MRRVDEFKNELLKLKEKNYVDQKVVDNCLVRIEKDPRLTRETNPEDHFCTFFVPLHLPTNTIFLGHHIKANGWTPPGGHIDGDEAPIETVKREFYEELNFQLTDEKIELFDITVIPITNPKQVCKTHRDFWHIVYVKDKTDYKYDKKEFFDMRWVPISEAINSFTKFPEFNKVYRELGIKYVI